ncbi:MAG: FAD-binding oxidoreductase [Flavobacteriales bacterium]|nr:FAD-binding oxidoreductase [Flavobacteriales bacterium]
MNSDRPFFRPSLSYWEIDHYLKDIDLLVVGSGIVGLTTAIFFKKKHPNKKVVLVEKGFLPSGASTKNAGFACFGSLSEILADLRFSTQDEVFALIAKRFEGLQELRTLTGDKTIDYQPCGGFEIFREEDESQFSACFDILEPMNNRIRDELGLEHTYSIQNEMISEFGFNGVSKMIWNRHEGSIDTGKMMAELLRIASASGIIILNSLEVSEWNDNQTYVQVSFANGLEIRAQKVHFATNGFAKSLLPDLDVEPARAQVLITSPIEGLKVRGTFHLDEGFFYFRNVGNRVLLGGGRNLALEAETTLELETTQLIQNRLDQLLKENILPNSEYEIEHRWAGIMGVGPKKKAILKQLTDNVSCAVRLGGMGVAIGTSLGKESTEMIA